MNLQLNSENLTSLDSRICLPQQCVLTQYKTYQNPTTIVITIHLVFNKEEIQEIPHRVVSQHNSTFNQSDTHTELISFST